MINQNWHHGKQTNNLSCSVLNPCHLSNGVEIREHYPLNLQFDRVIVDLILFKIRSTYILKASLSRSKEREFQTYLIPSQRRLRRQHDFRHLKKLEGISLSNQQVLFLIFRGDARPLRERLGNDSGEVILPIICVCVCVCVCARVRVQY